jgi:hypothetical protein
VLLVVVNENGSARLLRIGGIHLLVHVLCVLFLG